MKQVYKCEYCDFIGDVEQVSIHEEKCIYNHKNKSCATCLYGIDNGFVISCGSNTTASFSCTYCEQENGLQIHSCNGNACEHYTQGNCKRIIAL